MDPELGVWTRPRGGIHERWNEVARNENCRGRLEVRARRNGEEARGGQHRHVVSAVNDAVVLVGCRRLGTVMALRVTMNEQVVAVTLRDGMRMLCRCEGSGSQRQKEQRVHRADSHHCRACYAIEVASHN